VYDTMQGHWHGLPQGPKPNLEVQSRWNNFKGITKLPPEWHLQDTIGLGRDRAKWGE